MNYISISKGNIIPAKSLSEKVLIAEGTFGHIFKANWEAKDAEANEVRHETVAIKMYKNATKAQVLTERNYLMTLEDTNIVGLVGLVLQNDSCWLVMEYLRDGDLRSYVLNAGGICGFGMMKIAWGIARGIAYLHDRNIVHGDLAARNCLVDGSNYDVKVGDFGSYYSSNKDCYYEYDSEGSCPVRWMPPENLPYEFSRHGNFFRKTPSKTMEGDVWAFGVLLFELWSQGKTPFDGLSNYQVCKALLEGKQPIQYCPVKMRKHMWDLMDICWESEPSSRPSFETIAHYFTKIAGFRRPDDADDTETLTDSLKTRCSRYTQFPDISCLSGKCF